jgi:putative tryptophan/tyrosine transport system substrate-binding protein
MRRREFLRVLGGTAAVWSLAPFAAFGQQTMRRIAVVIINGPDEPLGKDHIAAFRKRMVELGWIEGGNIAVEYRYSGGNAELVRAHPRNSSRFRPT